MRLLLPFVCRLVAVAIVVVLLLLLLWKLMSKFIYYRHLRCTAMYMYMSRLLHSFLCASSQRRRLHSRIVVAWLLLCSRCRVLDTVFVDCIQYNLCRVRWTLATVVATAFACHHCGCIRDRSLSYSFLGLLLLSPPYCRWHYLQRNQMQFVIIFTMYSYDVVVVDIYAFTYS